MRNSRLYKQREKWAFLISHFSLLIALASLTGCKSTRVPLTHRVEERIESHHIEGDSTSLRLAFGGCPDSLRQIDYTPGKLPGAPVIRWAVARDTVTIVATTPPRTVETLSRVEYREVPVEVEVTREVNVLLTWQKGLMWCGGLALLLLIIKVIRRILNY